MSEAEVSFLKRPYIRFAFAALAVVAAFALRQSLVRLTGAELPPYITFYPAIMVAALLCGLGPGLAATALAALAVDYWILPPQGSFTILHPADAISLAIFAAMGVFLSLVAEAYRRNRAKVASLKEALALQESEGKLRKTEEQFETLANAIPQLCWMANADGGIFWYNQRWYAYTGTTPEQMEGWGWKSVHDPETLPKVMERWQVSIATGEPFEMVFPLRSAGGAFRTFLTRVMPVKDSDGKVVRWFGTNTDIHAQKKFEAELQRMSESRRMALDAADLALWEYHFDSGEVYWDERGRKLFGVSAGDRLDYDLCIACIHSDDRAGVEEAVEQALAGANGGSYRREFRVVWPDGSVHWISSHGQAHFEGEGDERRAVRFLGVNMEVTGRKQAEEALHDSERRERERAAELAAVLDAVPVPVVIVHDPDSRHMTGNRAADELLRQPRGAEASLSAPPELRPRHFRALKDGRELQPDELPAQRAARGEHVHGFEFSLAFHDGPVRDLLGYAIPLLDEHGQPRGAALALVDITERKQAEEDSKNSFSSLSNFVPQLVWMCTPDGLNIYFNQRWVDYTGLTVEESYGRGWNTPFHPDDKQLAWDAWNRAVQSGGEYPYSVECRLRAADGSYRRFLIRGEPMRQASGEIHRWLGTCTDVEDLRQESEVRFRSVVENMSEGLILFDTKGNAIYHNPASLRIHALEGKEGEPLEAELLKAGWTGWDEQGRLLSPDEWPMSRIFREGRVQNQVLHAQRIETGHEFDASYNGSLLHDSAGNVTGGFITIHDITERKQAEVAKARLAAIVESSADAIISKSLDGTITSWNKSAEQMFGYTAEEIVGQPITLIVPRDRLEEEKDILDRLRRGECIDHFETVRVDKSGRMLEVSLTLSPIRDVAGNVLGASKILRDITDRKRAEKALQESEGRLRLFIEHAPAALAMFDREMRYLQVSRRWFSDYTLVDRDLRGQSHYEVFPEVSEWWKEAHRRGLAGEVVRSSGDRFVRGDGSVQWVRWEIRPWHDAKGEIGGIVIFAEDITESKVSEEALQASEHRWATTLQSIGDGVISTDVTGHIEFMNAVAERLTGWPLEEARGRDLSAVFDIVQELTRIKPESPVARVIRSGAVVSLANHTLLIHRDGTEIPIEDSAAPIRDSEGNMEGVVLVFHDCREQRRMAAALRSNERLATTGRLAATIAHEIHNPLDAVGNLLYLIGNDSQDDTTKEYAATASAELGRVTQMTQQMLAFQREGVKPVPVKIGEILANVVAVYDRKIQSAGIRLELRNDFHGHIMMMPGELRQVLANLVGNAVEAVGPRNGRIVLHAYASRDRRRGVAGLCVVVADDGPGIPAELRSRIFEPFFTTKGEAGTGLGLWIISDILRKYDGRLRVRSCTSPERSGTCFSVFLPLQESSDLAGSPRKVREPAGLD